MQAEVKTNNYSISTLLTLLGSVGLALAITLLHALDLGGLSEWLLDLAYGSEAFIFISQMISGDGYLFQFFDKLTDQKTLFEKIDEQIRQVQQKSNTNNPLIPQENFLKSTFKRLIIDNVFLGLTVGVLSAIGLTVAEVILHVATPFGLLGPALGHVIMLVNNLNLCGGLGNRTGRATGYFKNADNVFRAKDVNYALSIVAGILIGITITAVVLGLIGVTAISGGSALPVILFCASMIGGCASASGYIGRVFDFILGERTIIGAVQDKIELKEIKKSSTPTSANKLQLAPGPIKKRINKENILTAAGVGIGIAVGVALIVAGAVMLPFFGAGLPKLVAGFIVLTTCISAGGGTGNRIGFALDRNSWKFWEWFKKPKPKDSKDDGPVQNNTATTSKKPYANEHLNESVGPSKQSGNTVYGRFFKRSQSMTDLEQYKNTKQSNNENKFFKRSMSMPDLHSNSSNDEAFEQKIKNNKSC